MSEQTQRIEDARLHPADYARYMEQRQLILDNDQTASYAIHEMEALLDLLKRKYNENPFVLISEYRYLVAQENGLGDGPL